MPDVRCKHCCAIMLETTDRFDPNITVNAAMFKLKPIYMAAGETFCDTEIPTDSIEGECVFCPNCRMPLCNSDNLFNGMLIEQEPQGGQYKCEKCGKRFGYPIALAGHMRSHDS